jgi:hypothetical protein
MNDVIFIASLLRYICNPLINMLSKQGTVRYNLLALLSFFLRNMFIFHVKKPDRVITHATSNSKQGYAEENVFWNCLKCRI